jgi:SAM-dependent methyltransferase
MGAAIVDVRKFKPQAHSRPMTKKEFIQAATSISQRDPGIAKMHGYFVHSAQRLYFSCQEFGLFDEPLGDVLELGPFYGYIPFMIRKSSSSYTVLEGDDSAVYPLIPLYKEHGIQFEFIDYFEIFGPVKHATHRLPFSDNKFDRILCWQTMEHFCFNPVKFVRELLRILKPDGKVFITVPNKASFQSFVGLMFGRGEQKQIKEYFEFENHQSGGKTAFYGFHWREYTVTELSKLFATAGFQILRCRTATVFFDHGKISIARHMLRYLSTIATLAFPRFGTNVFLAAKK